MHIIRDDLTNYPFIPKDQELGFFNQNHINKVTLPNGITILGMPEVIESAVDGRVEVYFSMGSCLDPDDKSGLLHLLEHFSMDPNLFKELRKFGVLYNAQTHKFWLRYEISGAANPGVLEYGIWPFIEQFANTLISPFAHHKDKELELKREKEILIREIAQRRNNPRSAALKWRKEIFIDSANPLLEKDHIKDDEIRAITVEEISEYAKHVIVPEGTIIVVYTKGERENNKLLVDQVAKAFINMKRTEQPVSSIDGKLLDRINPSYKQGQIFIRNKENITKETREFELVWHFESENFSKDNYLLVRLKNILARIVHDYMRDNGLSYGIKGDFEYFGINCFLYLTGQLQNRKDMADFIMSELWPKIKDHIIKNCDQDFTITEIDRLAKKARPVQRGYFIGQNVSSFISYGRFLDFDEMRRRDDSITTQDLLGARDKLFNIDPAVILH